MWSILCGYFTAEVQQPQNWHLSTMSPSGGNAVLGQVRRTR